MKAKAIKATCSTGKDLNPAYINPIFTENMSRNVSAFMGWTLIPPYMTGYVAWS